MKTNVSYSIIRRMRNISDKSCTENQNTYFMSSNFLPPPPSEKRCVRVNVQKKYKPG